MKRTGLHLLATALCTLLLASHAAAAPGQHARPAARQLQSNAGADAGAGPADSAAAAPRQAYATLLYGDDFLLGVRVLGQSLRETGTTRDLVVLVTRDVSEASAATLASDGWKVLRVDLIENPGQWTQEKAQKFPQRFAGVYTKLLIFNLTQYERVVYLDADTSAVRAMDELFRCDGLCGVLRHSERINTGLMVLTPSEPLFNAMMAAIVDTPSYTGGDQGFLNSFFADWAAAPLFDPRKGQLLSTSSEWRTATPQAGGLPLGRLPTIYNADLGLFIMNSNHWTLPPQEIRVLHYTLATFKPWDWWSGWIMGGTSRQWQAMRARLPPSAEGVPGGQTRQQKTAAMLLLVAPLLATALLVRRCLWHQGLGLFLRCCCCRLRAAAPGAALLGRARHSRGGGPGSSSPQAASGRVELQHLLDFMGAAGASIAVPAWLTAAAACAGVASVLAALGSGVLLLIPRQVVPQLGWLLAYEWTALSFVVLYSSFLQACHWHGRGGSGAGLAAASAAGQHQQGLRRPWGASILLFATVLFSLGLIPWWADILRVRSFVGKALFTIFMGVLSVIVCTQTFISLAARWYQCGVAEAAASRVGSKVVQLSDAAAAYLELAAERDSDGLQEIAQLVASEDEQALADRLGSRLQFGTAGLRGLMGAGYSRMNAITVQQTTQGLVRYLQQQEPQRLQRGGVAIGYDGRHRSKEFAAIAAAVCAARGVPVWLFSEMVPTPFVPAAVQQLGCAAGVMVTASHNPAAYNGYKVYWSNACQIIPPHDAGIAAAIEQNLELWDLPPGCATYEHPLVQDPLPQVADRFYSSLRERLHYRSAAANAEAPAMAYTALHGVGTPWLLRAFREFGLPPPALAAKQCEPDPDFSTVSFPNPEEGEGAWLLAFQAAEAGGGPVAIANDPDADRFAVAERDQQTGEWHAFTGNEIGAMLAAWVLQNYRQRQQQQQQQPKLAVLSSTVSSKMLAAMAAAEGVHWEETLTGFKWLGNMALRLEEQGHTVLFAFEEAIGFMMGEIEHDKDGISAAAVFAELTADVYAQGETLAGHWRQLQQRYGAFEYRSGYFIADPPSRSGAVFERLRAQVPASIAGLEVQSVRDLGTGVDTAQPDGKAVLPWTPGDLMVTYTLRDAWVTLRASGTEPKLKFYLEARSAEAQSAAAEIAEKLQAAVEAELVQPDAHGLRRPQH